MLDRFGRSIEYMRISITDRCNLRCIYCMPEGVDLVSMKDILTYEEICEICSAAAALGIRKLKITGGEPLARLGCADLIRSLKEIPGIEQVTMTTNGVLLGKCLPSLLDAGLDAVNVSLDTLNRERFSAITGRDELLSVLDSVERVLDSKLRLKINVVLQRGINDGEWYELASLARDRQMDVRFIELMPIGFGQKREGVANTELKERFRALHPDLQEDSSVHGNGPAVYLRIPGWTGSIGFISAMHGKFCGSCNRIRLTAQGRLKPCLCYGETANLMPILRGSPGDKPSEAMLRQAIEQAVYAKPEQHCFEEPDMITETGRMISIGG